MNKCNEVACKYQEYLRETYRVDRCRHFSSKKSVIHRLLSMIKKFMSK